jgi:sporulation protein YlmC with PRC-barrel domain
MEFIQHRHFAACLPIANFPVSNKTNQQEAPMHKFSTRFATAAAMAIFCSLAAPGFAQTATGPAHVSAEHGMRASKMVGMSVYNEQNQNIGSIVDIMIDNTTGVATAILSVGSFVGGGTKLVEVPLGHVKLEGSKAMMPGATKQALAAMPVYNFGGGN